MWGLMQAFKVVAVRQRGIFACFLPIWVPQWHDKSTRRQSAAGCLGRQRCHCNDNDFVKWTLTPRVFCRLAYETGSVFVEIIYNYGDIMTFLCTFCMILITL